MAAYGKKGKGLTPKKARANGGNALARAEAQGRAASGKPKAKYSGGPVSTKAKPNAYRGPNPTNFQKKGITRALSNPGSKKRSPTATNKLQSNQSPTITKTVNTPAAPFLTADQEQARDSTISKYQQQVQDLTTSLGVKNQATNTALQAATLAHARSANQENQLAAARGVFQSSIHDNDLNDLDAALVERQNMLNSALKTFTDQVNSHVAMIQNTYIPQIQQQYNQDAVDNAAAVTPSTTTQTVPNPNYKPPSNSNASTGGKSGSTKSPGVKMPGFKNPKVGPGRIPGGTRPTGNISYKPAAQPRLNIGFHFTNPLQGRPHAGRQGGGNRSGGRGFGVRI